MISPLDVSILDINSEELGVKTSTLMENAGRGLAEEIIKEEDIHAVLFITGTGNNGGDGMVAARILSERGIDASVILIRPAERIGSGLARKAFEDLPDDVMISLWDGSLPESDLIVDGLLGSGAKGTPRGDYADAVREMNSADCGKIAIDIPTGLGTQICFRADRTVTFHDVKSNMPGTEDCGEIIIKDIGIPQKAAEYVGKGDLLRIPSKNKESHKGESGKVLIIGGGPFTGAPILAALAAVNIGSDLVRVAVPAGIWQVAASASPDIIVQRLGTGDHFSLVPEMMDELTETIEWADSILIGPGAGRSQETIAALSKMISVCMDRQKRLVIDADGITAVSSMIKSLKGAGNVLITPHRMELKRLLDGMDIGYDEKKLDDPFKGSQSPEKWAIEALDPLVRFTRITGCDLLVKGSTDLVMTCSQHSLDRWISHHPAYIRYIDRGVPEMSVGGTGDVLAGICTGLMAKGMSPFDSGCVGAYINGRAGEITRDEIGISLSASELLGRIHQVLSGS